MAVLYRRDCYSSSPAQYGTESLKDWDTCKKGTTEEVGEVNVENIVERRQNKNKEEILAETEWSSPETCLQVPNSRKLSNYSTTGEIVLGESILDRGDSYNQPKQAGMVLLARTMRAIRLRMRRRKGAKARAILESHF